MPYKNKADAKACRERNKAAKAAYMREYHKKNADRINTRCAKWYEENKERAIKRQKDYNKANPEINRKAAMEYRKRKQVEDPEFEKKRSRKTMDKRKENPDKWNAYSRAYANKRYAEDPEFNIACRLRSRLYQKLRVQGATKSASALDLTGCTTEFLRGYIEGMFRDGMNWNNIHVDHILPLASFNLCNEDDQRKAFHYTNLQPLFGAENLAKGAKI